MKRTAATCFLLIVVVCIFVTMASSLLFAEAAEKLKNIPPGVDPGKWMPIKKNLGFIVTRIEPSRIDFGPKN
jgi:hypothetical protein